MRFDELKSQLKADQVERIAEISVKDKQHIVAYIKQALCKGVAQQKAKESRGKARQVELGPRPKSKLEISLGWSPKAEILKHNNRHGRQSRAREAERGKKREREGKKVQPRLHGISNSMLDS